MAATNKPGAPALLDEHLRYVEPEESAKELLDDERSGSAEGIVANAEEVAVGSS